MDQCNNSTPALFIIKYEEMLPKPKAENIAQA